MECYIDDITVKSRSESNHLDDLRIMSHIMQAYKLKMNPTKSFLGVSSVKFLGLIVTSKGIHLDPDKVKTIQGMQPPKTLKELKGLQRQTCLYLEIYRKSFGPLPTVYTVNEERCLLHVG